jgi:hypothetical protein
VFGLEAIHRGEMFSRSDSAAGMHHAVSACTLAFTGIEPRPETPAIAPVRPICTLQRAAPSDGVRKPFVWHCRRFRPTHPGQLGHADGVETSQQKSHQLDKSSASLASPRRHQGAAWKCPSSSAALDAIWHISLKRMQEPWLTVEVDHGLASHLISPDPVMCDQLISLGLSEFAIAATVLELDEPAPLVAITGRTGRSSRSPLRRKLCWSPARSCIGSIASILCGRAKGVPRDEDKAFTDPVRDWALKLNVRVLKFLTGNFARPADLAQFAHSITVPSP